MSAHTCGSPHQYLGPDFVHQYFAMLEELQIASSLLSAALERYSAACSAIANLYDPHDSLCSISAAISAALPGELKLMELYGNKLKEARTYARRTRNVIPSIVPINTLPPDLLANIFALTITTKPCDTLFPFAKGGDYRSSRYPEALSHVCSRWRFAAINCRSLWCHIDLNADHRRNSIYHKRVIARAETFQVRAGHMLLDIHFVNKSHTKGRETDMNKFCSSVATRIRRIEFEGSGSPALRPFLESSLTNTTPGTLRQLVIWENSPCPPFIETAESPVHPGNSLQLEISPKALEDILYHVNVLCLTKTFFEWTSQAYHGLVELRLLFGQTAISQLQLAGVLSASPRLRILHFNLVISSCWFGPSVELLDLEELNLRHMQLEQCEYLLALISPNSTPLRLLLGCGSATWGLSLTEDIAFGDQLKSFVAQSNIKELLLEHYNYNYMSHKLHVLLEPLTLANLQVLHLHKFQLNDDCSCERCSTREDNPPNPAEGEDAKPTLAHSHPRIPHLCLSSCRANLKALAETIRLFSIQEVNVGGGAVGATSQVGSKWVIGPEDIAQKLVSTFPETRTKYVPEDVLREAWGLKM